ncbi:MAG: MarR family transcriptional regulator [Clostridia bacterium]
METVISKKWEIYNKINKEFEELYHKIAVNYNISDSSLWILYALYQSDHSYTQMDICREWYFNKQTVNSAIKNLEKLGYINKEFGEENKQDKKITLTNLGYDFAEKTVKNVIMIEKIAFSKISEKELEKMIELLQKVLFSLKEEAEKKIL